MSTVSHWILVILICPNCFCFMLISVPVEGEDASSQSPIVVSKLKSQIVDEGQTAIFECGFTVQPQLEVSKSGVSF